ncbi:PilZ domain-containing protein [Thalassotalea marina]|uniref:Pilus assembly protein PilZ n=1 Tax=Thalassotalea marina TaxID=1673741 RepID=A0A919BEB8_9GAMM|nr:PilZ domain-containing protein [Thalassotalea marina]GHF85980.1 pilus assembly protein PilZ [Thalassotalea marina]
MIKDFSKYQAIIDEFRGIVLADDFEANFAQRTDSLNKTERFLLKMELKRLATPCTRLVDLRGHVDGECRAFEHDGRVHYLDDVAINVYQETVEAYGAYTFGVYEAVMNTENNFRVMYQKEKTASLQGQVPKQTTAKVFEKTQYPATIQNFGPFYNRRDERMNFAIQLVMVLSENNVIEAVSSDISVNGCKIRLSKPINLATRQVLQIRFTGFEEDFQFKKDEIFSYEVRNQQTVDNIQLIGLQRVYISDESRDGFKQFLKGFIQGNKRRYKINLDNSISALQARTFEQFVLPKSSELPVFLEDNGIDALPRYALTCPNNQRIYQYWRDEEKNSTLNFLITPERILRLKKDVADGQSLLVFSFTHHSQGKSYFYTADSVQLDHDKAFANEFLGFASNKPSFAIHQLQLLPVVESRAETVMTLSTSLTVKDQHLALPVEDDVKAILSRLSNIVVVNKIHTNELVDFYKGLAYQDINTSKLKQFGHKRLAEPLAMDEVGINFNNQRSESRFKYKTQAQIASAGVSWDGVSEDFSTLGLKIELNKASVLNKGDIVYLSFPQLQKITSAFELKDLPYEVMRVNKDKTVISLRVHVEKHKHIGRAFFKALIEKNRHKLTPDEYALFSPGLAKALRNIYSRSSTALSMIIQTSGSRYKIEKITTNAERTELLEHCKRLSDRVNTYNLYPLLANQQATSFMHSTLKKLQAEDEPIVDMLYVAIEFGDKPVDQSVTAKLASELPTDLVKKLFIRKALKRGDFFCFQVKLSRTKTPDMHYLNPELSYISSYAIHRGKQLEQDIYSVAGIVQVFDITQEALTRYRIMKEDEFSPSTANLNALG